MVFSAGYYEQKHIYTAWGERMEQFTERGNWDRLLYVHEDIMGNTRYYTKDNGQSFAELEYDVWGAVTSPSKLTNNDNGNFAAAVFTGHPYDTVLDIYFAEARFYDAKYRQWMASDPIKDGLNWYLYANGNPATYWDPNGLSSVRIGQVIDYAVTKAKNFANETHINIEKWNQQRQEEYDREVERLGAEIREKNRIYEEELARVQRLMRLEKAIKTKEKHDAYDRDILRLGTEIREKNRIYEEELVRVHRSMRLEEAIKKKEKYDAYDRAVIVERQKLFAKQEAERQLWEAYYQDPTLPPTPLEELAGWAGGHLKNHVEDTKLYFRRITCEVEKARILNLISNPIEQARYNMFVINETIQWGGRILGDFNLTFMLNLDYGINLADLTHGASIGFALDTKGNIWALATHTEGASLSMDPTPGWYIDGSVLAMPGGKIENWEGTAENYGASVTWDGLSFGADYVELVTEREGREPRVVLSAKITPDFVGAEIHGTKSVTESGKHWQEPFNIYNWLDSSTKNLREILNFQQPKNINRGQAR